MKPQYQKPTLQKPIIHLGDNLPFIKSIPTESIDLIYIDPPYNTGSTKTGKNGQYDDAWPNIKDYIAFLKPRITQMYRTLKPTASILIHCDWRTSHHIRLLLDKIFTPENFINHLIWKYGLGGSSPRTFARKHDDILFYGKSKDYYFSPPLVPATSQRMKGQLKKATDIIDIPSLNKSATDILDIPTLNNMAKERTGYPTQKPIALLKLLIEACSPPDATIADFFCGSGTTLAATLELNRKAIACDQSPQAIKITNSRLTDHWNSHPLT